MKRIATVGACLVALAAGASAQTALVKSAKNDFKAAIGAADYPTYRAVVETLTPAFSDPETANMAETYFVPGEAGFKVYDSYLLAVEVGNEVNTDHMGKALLDGYDFFMKAFAVDSLPDEKGKVKPKYSKKMVDVIVGHVDDFNRAAVGFWQAKDFDNAYRAWDIRLAIPAEARYSKSGVKADADSVVSQIRFNQALAAWQGEKFDKAIRAFDQALSKGNKDPEAYEYAYSVAYQAKDSKKKKKFAEQGLKLFGTTDPKFLQWTVNCYIDKKDYAGASKLLDDAIAADPQNATYFASYGVLNENAGNRDAAKANYLKSLQIDPANYQSNFNYGRMLAEDYDALDQETGNMSQAEYSKYAAETLNPILVKSAEYFEAAHKANTEERAPLMYLKNIYYRLADGDNLKRIEDELKYM